MQSYQNDRINFLEHSLQCLRLLVYILLELFEHLYGLQVPWWHHLTSV